MFEDLRDAWRHLRRARGPAAVTVVVLALGVGAAITVFSIVDGVLLRPLPYPEPRQLVRIYESNPEQGRIFDGPSPIDYLDWAASADSFAHLAAAYSRPATLSGDGRPQAVQISQVTPAFFEALRVQPSAGHFFDPAQGGAAFDGAARFASGARQAVLSYGLWRSRYGGDLDMVGRDVSIDRVMWRVVGVAPKNFDLPAEATDVWLAWDIAESYAHMDRDSGAGRDWRFLYVIGRIDPALGQIVARDELSAISDDLARRFPATNEGWTATLVPLRESLVGHVRGALFVMLGAVVCVLLIALTNAAGLQLATASERERELAVRAALGAPHARLLRQLLSESLILGLGGATLGLACAAGALRLLVRLRPEGLPRLHEIGLDPGLCGIALGAAGLGAFLAGWLPARQAAAAELSPALRDGGRGAAGSGRARLRLRRLLVSAQAGVALMLVAGALLFTRTFLQVLAVSPGFDTDHLLVARMRVEGDAGPFYRALLEKLRALPGVTAAGAATAMPMSEIGTDFDRPYWLEGEERLESRARLGDIRMVTPGYFDTLGLPLLRGRSFDGRDVPGGRRVVAISQGLARREWPGANAIGRRLAIDYLGAAYIYEVVAIVGDTRFRSLREDPRPEIYIPHEQNAYLEMNVVVRAATAPGLLAAAVRRTIAELDPEQAVHSIVTMDALLSRATARERLAAALLGALSALAAALAAAGLYALQAYLVGRRTAEIGVRMALGARGTDVARLVLGDALRTALPGAILGFIMALLLARALRGMLFQVGPADPFALGGAALVVALLTIVAGLAPARRASRVDPTVALRSE